jgi:hypothetical protein
MAARSKEQHQPEPWRYEGRAIVNSAGWTLAKTIFEADARRIVAAINDVLGIPTAALESGFIREILVPRPDTTSEVSIRVHPLPQLSVDAAEFFLHDRRMGERRKGDRRKGVAASPRILSLAD